MSSVKVAVRVRPVNKRELNAGSKCIIEMEGKRTSIINLKMQNYRTTESEDQLGRERVKDFFFDYSYWSYDEGSPNFTSQSVVFKDLGTGVVQAADEGYNACIFAYGQTGSGKTHTMMGQPGNEGLIPRICESLFQQIREKEEEGVSFRAEVSYLEIYNEKVRDLLRSHQSKNEKDTHTLKVREHPKNGPYVQGLTKHLVPDYPAIELLMQQGSELRSTAATNMNDTSSRSHAIFTVNYTQAKFLHDLPSETTSKINLVDLAGSERADSTGASGIRLKEGANINKSLVTLGSVISSLAELSTNTKKKNTFIPYRDSVLTWLLKDSLGGNSKTIMIATLSPADINYAETLSTLRYANRAKNIVNKPTVNEDDNVKLIRDLRAEIDKLKGIIGQEVILMSDGEKATAKKLFENEERLGALTDKWKYRWKEMQNIMQERELAFQHRLDAGIRMESDLPHLVALEDDLLSTGVLLYHLKGGKTYVGTENSKTKPDIVINGPSILDEHCIIENNDGFVLLEPFPDATCSVNGANVRKRVRLQQGDVVKLGTTTTFRFNNPKEAEELREKRKSVGPSMVPKFRGESDRIGSDLLQMRRNPERDKREENLSKQLEEARLLLEKQKQEEERRMEETRNEFARQIREESRRLQETRGELESQRKGVLQEPQNIEQIRSHIESLQQRHHEAEDKRVQREKDLSENVSKKENLIETQRKKLTEFESKCLEVKTENDKRVDNEVGKFMGSRREETTKLDDEIRKVVDATLEEGETDRIKDIRNLWEEETNKVDKQENLCADITNEYNESINNSTLDLSKAGLIDDDNEPFKQREDISQQLSVAQTMLEEMMHNKAKALKKYEQDYKNRFELICWEKEKASKKVKEKKELTDNEKRSYQESLIDTQSLLDEVKAKYFETLSQENEILSTERSKVNIRKKDLIKMSIEEQQHFNEKVQQYRSLLKKGQENINEKKIETEELRQELTELMKVKNENIQSKIDSITVELNDKIEDLHELENNHNIVKKEEEKVIQSMLTELNNKKQHNEKDVEMSEKTLLELEQTSREKILNLQEEVDATEKTVLQYRSNIDRCDEKLIEIDKINEADTGKLDTELLYVAYMIEKKFQDDSDSPEVTTIQDSKTKLEDIYKTYKMNLENIQKETDIVWKPLVDNREEAQVVLEDLIRSRGIAEVTLNEIKEQFSSERKEELEEIQSWRERLVDLEEERNISVFCSENEITDSQNHENEETKLCESVLLKEKQELEDDMYEKIIMMERIMQEEINQLKKREAELLACIENNQNGVEETNDVSVKDLAKLQELLLEKEKELNVIKEQDNREIEELRAKLENANKEILILHEELDKYVSMTSLTMDTLTDEELSETEVRHLLMRVNESSGIEEEDEEIARLRISPPPTPINRFLQSVNIYKRNQIKVAIPRFILRGIGRGSYHVFEVKLNVGDEHWTVYRRYRRFRELHRQILLEYPIVSNLEFPSKRFFGNRAEKFVKIRRAQLETYLTAFFAIMSNVANCILYAVSDTPLTKQDIGRFHAFFKQGVYEYTKNESDFINR